MSKKNLSRVLPCILVLFFGAGWPDLAFAGDQGHGRVSMQGSIIDTPCAIATDDIDQTIDMGVTTIGEIKRAGMGVKHPFTLELVNCDLHPHTPNKPDWSRFNVTFDGPVQSGAFSVNGASGIGLEIADERGNVAIPGKSLPDSPLQVGNQILRYTLQLIGNHQQLSGGEYRTSIRFKVDYF